ncbi:YggT family protein [Mobilicoccus caccae]|uniref:YggT family protein n=1 Tax=Mobilicoccus caccae TaxID=1859295 RepID=A0ABQ6IRS3_9MICO|nr:YggT family protein [Mobilicoccus caccae]GMA40035.1 YggT family protein [Mobilicoccus caccae]
MAPLLAILVTVLNLYLFVLIARLVVDWIQVFARDWRPTGFVLVIVEGIYTLTDPPLKALRKVIPPLRLGGIALDLAFIVLFIGLSLLISVLSRLALTV